MRWWEEVFRGEDALAYSRLRVRQQRGQRPALLLIDVVRSFTGSPGLSLAEAIAEWPTACGPAADAALPHIAALLQSARTAGGGRGIPVVHCRPGTEYIAYYGDTVKGEMNAPGGCINARPGALDFAPQALPREGELVIPKPKASAFFATPLAVYLRRIGVDSLLVAGCTTSGCVRATVVDACSWGFATFVVEEAVFDRSRLSAAVSLYEMDVKYADVIPLADALTWLEAP